MKQLTLRASDGEIDRLDSLCDLAERTRNDVIREAIRRYLKDEYEPLLAPRDEAAIALEKN